jgi:beta-phosphoglucomutase-like phosphatase (HAD superfamily)
VKDAKPEPDLFSLCSQRLGISPPDCFAVVDAVWDMLAAKRAGMLSVGLLSGGMTEQVLAQADAYRVYRDPADMNQQLFEWEFSRVLRPHFAAYAVRLLIGKECDAAAEGKVPKI